MMPLWVRDKITIGAMVGFPPGIVEGLEAACPLMPMGGGSTIRCEKTLQGVSGEIALINIGITK